MYGLAAIQQANGWAMAVAGACIVLTGLAVLAFLISLIPHLTGFFEEKAHPPDESAARATKPKIIAPDKLPDDLDAASTVYISLTSELGNDFSLIDLHRKSREVGLPHPHLSINRFRDAGILVPVGEGIFSWQPSAAKE
jgi:Na+-transporting methylmalonyl-CoA/oxaloacetate decarboxylase gamma subunit